MKSATILVITFSMFFFHISSQKYCVTVCACYEGLTDLKNNSGIALPCLQSDKNSLIQDYALAIQNDILIDSEYMNMT